MIKSTCKVKRQSMDITQKHYSRSNPKQNKDSDKLQEMASSRKCKSSAASFSAADISKRAGRIRKKMMAEKANEWTQREDEERSRLDRGPAQHDRDVVLLTANKKLDVANAKQRVTEEAIQNEKMKANR